MTIETLDRLTEQKAQRILDRGGWTITGVVMTNKKGEKCVCDMARVQWGDEDEIAAIEAHQLGNPIPPENSSR